MEEEIDGEVEIEEERGLWGLRGAMGGPKSLTSPSSADESRQDVESTM